MDAGRRDTRGGLGDCPSSGVIKSCDTSAASDVLGTMPAAASLRLLTSTVPSSSSGPFSIRNVDIFTHVPVKLDYDGHREEDEEEWRRVDVTIVLWIYTTMSDELLDEVMTAHGTFREVWAQLRDFFDYEDEHVALDAGEELRYGAQGDLSIDGYCWRLQALAEALAERGEPVEERVLTLLMLRGLSPRFQAMGAALLVCPAVPSFMQAFARLHLEEYDQNHGQGAVQ
ncbi:hypothetical protein QYE76_006132 [Lolium multiflorum]|uniref:Uncharacterized protein n=1 Tax=Lolium multiflorum TaxID=4521 RepID=A0AAD8W1V2_LOLMU|nr:hypothetical protein QYE76_006132 [Lolium multiflorum]